MFGVWCLVFGVCVCVCVCAFFLVWHSCAVCWLFASVPAALCCFALRARVPVVSVCPRKICPQQCEARAQNMHAARAVIAQLVARRSHNPKVVSSILTHRIALCRMQEPGKAGGHAKPWFCRPILNGAMAKMHTPTVGLEPMTTRLRALRSAD